MSKTLTQVSRDAAELSAAEQLKLARILLELSEPDAEPLEAVEAAWEEELQRRLQELRSGKVQAIPLEEVRKKFEKRFRS